MTFPTKPSGYSAWVPDEDPAKVTEPSGSKKALGFVAEQPLAVNFNWLFARMGNWEKYFDEAMDIVNAGRYYNAVVGASGGDAKDYDTLADAIAAASPGWRILVMDNETINTTVVVNVNNVEIVFKPGVIFSKGTVAKGISVTQTNVRIIGGRFTGYTAASDVAIEFTAGGEYGWIERTAFEASTDTEIDDTAVPAGKKPTISTISE